MITFPRIRMIYVVADVVVAFTQGHDRGTQTESTQQQQQQQ